MHAANIEKLLSRIESQAKLPKLKSRPPSKDYSLENVNRLRQLQATCQRQREETNRPLKPLKADHYSHVASKVTAFIQCQPQGSRPVSATNYLRAHSKTGTPVSDRVVACGTEKDQGLQADEEENQQPNIVVGDSESRSRLPRPASVTRLDLSQVDYVKLNAASVHNPKLKRTTSATTIGTSQDRPSTKQHPIGTVPKYLLDRKQQWQDERDRLQKEEEQSHIPAGHSVIPEDERKDTLELLQKNEQDLLQQLASLPVRLDTLRIRRQREELENQLNKIEEGIKIFSRAVVYVKNDS